MKWIKTILITHTIASGHAFSTLQEMTLVAKEKGLEILGITEHGPNIPGTWETLYRSGDRVMQIRNNDDKDVYNRDIGTVSDADLEENKLLVSFGDKVVTYEKSELDELVLAYATTIHQSQEDLCAHRTSKGIGLCGEEPYRGAKEYQVEGKIKNK